MKFKRFMMLAALLVSSVAAMVAQEMQMPPIPIDLQRFGAFPRLGTARLYPSHWC